MRIEVFSHNVVNVNTYFLIQNNDCLLIDPGSNTKQILKKIDDNGLNVLGVILTHAHFDHFLSCNEINQLFNVPLYVHPKGVEMLYDPEKNVSAAIPRVPPQLINQNVLVSTINEETKEIEGFTLNVLHVPGHSPDSVCLYFKEEKVVFTGDALFKLSIGRTDFYKGNEKQLITNIKNKLFTLPDETIVYPGHGPESTIGYEKKNNYYIK